MNIHTRANDFDRRVGKLQTELVIQKGVGESILDIGCGVGEYTPMFLKRFKIVVGLDPNTEYLLEASERNDGVLYRQGSGETFESETIFDTISLNNVLEHVDYPVELLVNCKKYLSKDGLIIVQVPNCDTVTRRLGVKMGIIDDVTNISEKEKNFYGHKRVYSIASLNEDCYRAGLDIIENGGVLYKPLPNDMLEEICLKQGQKWTDKFIRALVEFGKNRPDECASIYAICE